MHAHAQVSSKPVFAVVEVGPTQFKVCQGDTIVTEKLKGLDVNEKVSLNRVLMLGTLQQTVIGRPFVPQASVTAAVEVPPLSWVMCSSGVQLRILTACLTVFIRHLYYLMLQVQYESWPQRYCCYAVGTISRWQSYHLQKETQKKFQAPKWAQTGNPSSPAEPRFGLCSATMSSSSSALHMVKVL